MKFYQNRPAQTIDTFKSPSRVFHVPVRVPPDTDIEIRVLRFVSECPTLHITIEGLCLERIEDLEKKLRS